MELTAYRNGFTVADCGPGDLLKITSLVRHSNRNGAQHGFSYQNLPEFAAAIDISQNDKLQNKLQDELSMRARVQDIIYNGPAGNPVVNEHLTLMPHQQAAREIAGIRDKFAFYYKQRTGKTPLALAIINDDLQVNPDNKWLVVAPLSLLNLAWADDAKKFFPNMKVSVCHGTREKRIENIQADANVYLINTESFINFKEFFRPMNGVFVDESSSMKSHSTKISKELTKYLQDCPRGYLLSGTPTPNSLTEIYMQGCALDKYGWEQSYSKFCRNFFIDVSRDVRFSKWIPNQLTINILHDRIAKYSISCEQEDVLQLPGRDFVEYEFDMPPELAQQYKTLRKEMALQIADDIIPAQSAAILINKLKQVAAGFLIDTEKLNAGQEDNWHVLSTFRLEALQSILDKHPGEQVLIWAYFRHEFEQIEKMLAGKCACVYGATSYNDKIANIQAFKDGKLQYLIASPASIAHGLTLTNCHICVYYDITESYEQFSQSNQRIYGDIRIQPNKCLYYIMEAKGTINRSIYQTVLQNKHDAVTALMDHLRPGYYEL